MKQRNVFGLSLLSLLSVTILSESFYNHKNSNLTVSYCGDNPHSFTVKYMKLGYHVVSSKTKEDFKTYVIMTKN